MLILPFFVSGLYSCLLFQQIFDDRHMIKCRCDQNWCLVVVVCAVDQCLVLILNVSVARNVIMKEYFAKRVNDFNPIFTHIEKDPTAINILTISRCPMVQAVCNGYTLDMLQ